jgi:hypothetical protein
VKCEIKLPGEDSTAGGFGGYQRYRLKQFAQELANGLYGRSYEAVGEDLLRYLKQEKTSQDTFVEPYRSWMADEVFRAMEDPRKVLRLGCLANGSNNQGTFYHGIFVCEAKDQGPEYIFTSSSQSEGKLGDINKHVSLEVDLLNPTSNGLPELITKKWVNGLYFTRRLKARKVLFPWPEFLKIWLV